MIRQIDEEQFVESALAQEFCRQLRHVISCRDDENRRLAVLKPGKKRAENTACGAAIRAAGTFRAAEPLFEFVDPEHTRRDRLCGCNHRTHVAFALAHQAGEQLAGVISLIEKSGRPLLIIAEEVAPPVIMQLLARRDKNNFKVAAIHPPEFGHWRKAMLEDIAITTGGRVVSVDLGGKLEKAELHDLGSARQVRISSTKTLITAGGGDQKKIGARREQVMRQYDAAPENIERDKFQERIAKLSGGTAMILAGGATPVEQKRRAQLIEDAISATRAAIEEGIVPGGGVALLRVAPQLEDLINGLNGSAKQGAELLQRALTRPFFYIAANAGLNAETEVTKAAKAKNGHGLDARNGATVDLVKVGIIDPVKVCYSAVRNAASVAGLILTTQTLIAKKPDDYDPTAGPALGGGAELL